MPNHYQLEFGGGLGDVLRQLYFRGTYNVLRDMEPDATADVFLITHNPFAKELFAWHPNRDRITVHDLGYWSPAQDAEMRARHGMPAPGMNFRYGERDSELTFYPSPDDLAVLEPLLGTRYLVVAPSAGTPDRFIPRDLLVDSLLPTLRAACDLQLVMIGRSYERPLDDRSDWRQEYEWADQPGIVNAVDRLSVPGTAMLIQNAAGVVTAHSSPCLLAWIENKPEFLLYPRTVLDAHAPDGLPDDWLFGLHRRNTVATTFDGYTADHVRRFVSVL